MTSGNEQRREFWIHYNDERVVSFAYTSKEDADGSCSRGNKPEIHTTELREGEIVISREQLLQAFGQAYCSDENAHKELDARVGIELARILFGADTRENEG